MNLGGCIITWGIWRRLPCSPLQIPLVMDTSASKQLRTGTYELHLPLIAKTLLLGGKWMIVFLIWHESELLDVECWRQLPLEYDPSLRQAVLICLCDQLGGECSTIEEGRERQVTSYLRQWTQLTRLQRRGVAPVQPFSCGCTGATPCPCSLISCVLLAQMWRQQLPCHSLVSIYNLLLNG